MMHQIKSNVEKIAKNDHEDWASPPFSFSALSIDLAGDWLEKDAEVERLRQLVMHVRTEHWEELRALAHSQGAEDWGANYAFEAAQTWVAATSDLLEEWKPEAAESKGTG